MYFRFASCENLPQEEPGRIGSRAARFPRPPARKGFSGAMAPEITFWNHLVKEGALCPPARSSFAYKAFGMGITHLFCIFVSPKFGFSREKAAKFRGIALLFGIF